MKKIYSVAIAALCTLSATAGNFEVLKNFNRDDNREINAKSFTLVSNSTTSAKVMGTRAESAPASIVGMNFVTTYLEDPFNCNGFFTVKTAANDSITLEAFLGGYDLKAKYDSKTGTVTIPTGMVVGKNSNYGDITLYALVDPEKGSINTSPVVGTLEGNAISFNYGIVGCVQYNGGLAALYEMVNLKATQANGTMSCVSGSNKFDIPLLISKTAEDAISIVGISSIMYGVNYSVPVKFNATDNTASLSENAPVDKYPSTSTNRTYFIKGVANSSITGDLNFTVVANDNGSTLTATSQAGYVYLKSSDPITGNSYSGNIFSNFVLSADFNIYTAKVEAGSNEFDPNPTINNVTYTLNPETKTAEVTGCVEGINEINIPSTLNIQDVEYTVTSIKSAAFQGNRTITTIYLPATIKSMGTDAFRNVSNLRNLYIEDMAAWCALEFANGNANPIYNVFPTLERNWGKVYFNKTLFEGELNIPAGVTSIGRSFYGLKSLTKINFPATGLKTIGDQAFGNTTKLTEVTIPSSVTSVGSAFFGCSALAKVTLSEGLETMGNNMFYGCSALTEITVPSTVKSIAYSTFSSCNKITKITSLGTVPPVCPAIAGMTPFDAFYENATLFVPANSIETYKAADGWSVFTKIEAIPGSGIEVVEADVNAPVEYYNIQGQKVAADNLVQGIYVVRQGNKVSKVYVK